MPVNLTCALKKTMNIWFRREGTSSCDTNVTVCILVNIKFIQWPTREHLQREFSMSCKHKQAMCCRWNMLTWRSLRENIFTGWKEKQQKMIIFCSELHICKIPLPKQEHYFSTNAKINAFFFNRLFAKLNFLNVKCCKHSCTRTPKKGINLV